MIPHQKASLVIPYFFENQAFQAFSRYFYYFVAQSHKFDANAPLSNQIELLNAHFSFASAKVLKIFGSTKFFHYFFTKNIEKDRHFHSLPPYGASLSAFYHQKNQ